MHRGRGRSRQRDTGIHRGGSDRADTGDDLERHPGPSEFERFVGHPVEECRIAVHEPDHEALLSEAAGGVDNELRRAQDRQIRLVVIVTGVDDLHSRTREGLDNSMPTDLVEHDDVGRRQQLTAAHRHQPGIARTCADERDPCRGRLSGLGRGQRRHGRSSGNELIVRLVRHIQRIGVIGLIRPPRPWPARRPTPRSPHRHAAGRPGRGVRSRGRPSAGTPRAAARAPRGRR